MPPLDGAAAAELVQRAVPSLPDALRAHLVERTGARPGALSGAVRQLAGRAIVSQEDVDAALGRPPLGHPGVVRPRARHRAIERALDMGRFDDAAREARPARAVERRRRAGAGRARARARRARPRRSTTGARRAPGHRARGARGRGAARVADRCCPSTLASRASTTRPRSSPRPSWRPTEPTRSPPTRSAFAASRSPSPAKTGAARETLDRAVAIARRDGRRACEAVALGSRASRTSAPAGPTKRERPTTRRSLPRRARATRRPSRRCG